MTQTNIADEVTPAKLEGSSMRLSLREKLRSTLPAPMLAALRFSRPAEWKAVLGFLASREDGLNFGGCWNLVRRMYSISAKVPCEHSQAEIIEFIRAIFSLPHAMNGCIVEAGCYKGGGTAKLSVAARLANRKLVAFDSFAGIPENDEPAGRNVWGGEANFAGGDYCGRIGEVKANVEKFGEIAACGFVEGKFEDTLPAFRESVAAAYLDVDLASSTVTCLKYLWPLLVPGGFLFSEDGHLHRVLEVFGDELFWKRELQTERPEIYGFGYKKLIWMQKAPQANVG